MLILLIQSMIYYWHNSVYYYYKVNCFDWFSGKGWKRMVLKCTYVGEGFTRKPPKYERFIRPMVCIFNLMPIIILMIFCADQIHYQKHFEHFGKRWLTAGNFTGHLRWYTELYLLSYKWFYDHLNYYWRALVNWQNEIGLQAGVAVLVLGFRLGVHLRICINEK